jgi:hypothetical protein
MTPAINIMVKKKKRKKLTSILQNRWLPSDNTRPSVFVDRKKQANKKAARGRIIEW